jgi:hypothetical protein
LSAAWRPRGRLRGLMRVAFPLSGTDWARSGRSGRHRVSCPNDAIERLDIERPGIHFFMNDRFSSKYDPACAAALPNINAWVDQPNPDMQELLQLFLDQEWPIRAIVVGCPQVCGELIQDAQRAPAAGGLNQALLLRLRVDKHLKSSIIARMPLRPCGYGPDDGPAYTCESLALQTRELLSKAPGNVLFLWPADALNDILTPLVNEFSFEAVVALSSRGAGSSHNYGLRKLRRSLFDRGLICIGSVQVAGCTALCFLASAAVRSLRRCHDGSGGHVTMSELTNAAGFANQLFRYAYVKLYALRHDLTPAFPEWEGTRLYGLEDESSAHLTFRRLTFPGFMDHHRLMWDEHDPPIDIDLDGYFQEIPACWGRQRRLLRHLFQLAPEQQNSIDTWRHDATRGGQRTLVAIHVRRGTYRNLQLLESPWFRLVPERWYLAWLRSIWPTLHDPVLFVATDEPDAVLPLFAEFDTISADYAPSVQRLPSHVRDFELLRRADYLAICNSSFSRMAAILAPSAQKCFLPSFRTECFAPYEPWIDAVFWDRFADAWGSRRPSA